VEAEGIMLARNGFVPVPVRPTGRLVDGTCAAEVNWVGAGTGWAEGIVGIIWTVDAVVDGVYPPNPAPVHSGRIGD